MRTQTDREREAQDEIAATRVGRSGAWLLLGALVALIVTGSALEAARAARGEPTVFQGEPKVPGIRAGLSTLRTAGFLAVNTVYRNTLRALEDRMGRDSELSLRLRPWAQWHLYRHLGYGNSQVVVGRDGYLDYQGAFGHLTGRPFRDARELERRSASVPRELGLQPDPLPGLRRLSSNLARRGVRLLFLPVPVKSQIHPEPLLRARGLPLAELTGNPSTPELLTELERLGIATYDPSLELRAAALAGETLYFPTDTHWNPRGMEIVARGLARTLRERGLIDDAPPSGFESRIVEHEFEGDLTRLLGLGPLAASVPRERTAARIVTGLGGARYDANRTPAAILLLGDSYSAVLSLIGGGAASFPEQLAYELDRPVRKVAKTAENDLAKRVLWLRENPALLDGVQVVVYQVTARAFSMGNWSSVPLDRQRHKRRPS